jgi:hypothetical protein
MAKTNWIAPVYGQEQETQRRRIQDLRKAAESAGDIEQVRFCTRALAGDEDAWRECLDVLADGEAQVD